MSATISTVTRWAGRAVLMALVTMVTVTSASAETLMMPKRDARMNVPVVVWGVHTQAAGTACTIDFGDATSANCTGVDRSYVAFAHTYATQGTFTATLTVGTEVATVDVRVFDVALLPGGAAGDANRGLGINMAIEDGLRYLWTSQASRSANFPAGVTTHWGNSYADADAALIVLAFENHGYGLANNGSAPTGLYEKYVVRRGLNYIMSQLVAITLSAQPAGSPCAGGLGVAAGDCGGLTRPSNDHRGYINAVTMLPFAASGALARVNTEVGGATAGMTFGQILQRLSNTEVWGMTDSGLARGGVGYNHNGGQFDGSTVGWAVLAFLDAEAAGATVPAFVRTEFAFGFNNALNANGSFDYGVSTGNSGDGPHKTGIGLQGLFFIGDSGPRVGVVTANINSWWNGPTGGIGTNGWGCAMPPGSPLSYPYDTNKGCAYSMFNNFKGLKLNGITTLPGVARPAGPGSQPAGDWYADYQDWLVANQPSPNTIGGGSWGSKMGFSCCYNGDSIETAIAELILSPVALVLPDADKFAAVGLTPPTNTALELTTHTVTAKAESAGGTPVPGATVNFTILTGPNAGLTGTDTTDSSGLATFTYTDQGPEGSTGTDTIRASIGALQSNTVTMTWLPLNEPPVAVDDSAATFSGTPVTVAVLGNDSDPDTDPLTVSGTGGGPANGSVVVNGDGTITYTPNLAFAGTDSFTYDIADGKGGTATATVTITVTKRSLTVTANSYTRSYLAPDPTLEGTLVGVAPGDVITATYSSTGTGSQVPGVYPTVPALVDLGGKLPNYDVTSVNGTLTITNTAPVCTIAPSVTSIWPPNHKWVPVTASGATDVDGGPLTYTVVSIFQDEPTNTEGDGHTAIDGKGVGTNTAWVTAERMGKSWKDAKSGKGSVKSTSSGKSGKSSSSSKSDKGGGNGRVYHITFTVTDSLGLSCTATVLVGVPHDQSGPAPVDDGALYDSTVATPKVKSAKSEKSPKSAKADTKSSSKAGAKAPKGKK